jgi:archaea-specific DNA-binding protein
LAADAPEGKTILVGKKPVMNYVLACLTTFQNGSPQVTLKARGRAIPKAVDAALLTVERFSSGSSIRGIAIGTEQVEDLDSGKSSDVSSIEIELISQPTLPDYNLR